MGENMVSLPAMPEYTKKGNRVKSLSARNELNKALRVQPQHRAAFASLVISASTDEPTHITPCGDPQNDPDWWQQAASSEAGELAIRLCKYSCPIVEKCRDYALATREPLGIWGGMSQRMRTEHEKRKKLDAAKQEKRAS